MPSFATLNDLCLRNPVYHLGSLLCYYFIKLIDINFPPIMNTISYNYVELCPIEFQNFSSH